MATEQPLAERVEFTATELEPYRGKWLAFDPDRTRILAHGDSIVEAIKAATDLGFASAEYILELIPEEDTLIL